MKTILEVNNINKKVGKKSLLSNISFSINSSDIVGLIGPNGAGKTTIMKSILSLLKIDSGEISINGQNINYTSHHGLHEIGALIENPSLYPYLTGMDHVRMYTHKRKNVSKETMHIINELNMGKFINLKVKKYSLGMKQKMGILIALLNNPKLVILDEPMNGLDPKSNVELRNLILSLSKKGVSFLISSHILSELEIIVNRVVIINHGKIINKSYVNDLLSIGNTYLNLKTSNNSKSILLLNNKDFKTTTSEDGTFQIKLIDKHSIEQIFQLLYRNNIKIIDFYKSGSTLESSLLKAIYN
ncbi:ABC transporter ATP-binding protein [Apilactobacillus ozensis]|uniref:ABC transporter ATP-binding protein n=1 Tax=Apilactobacillus ozensis TaxID=866801 RepID=UPI000A96AA03|nr:ATP-binding cassette domain-containing protein [Apilactobacillus ozensis]